MLHIALCDDEEILLYKNSLLIESICIQFGIEHKITNYTSGKILLEEYPATPKDKFDIIFLDIEMPEMDGIQTAKKCREIDSHVLIIFLTSHTEFSRDGYKVNAFRFIDKMNKEEELKEAIKSAWSIQEEKKNLIVSSQNQAVLILNYNDIIYIEKRQRKTIIHSRTEGEINTYESITSFKMRLEDSCFYQVHRAFIVNLNYIARLIKKDIVLDNNNIIPLSEKKQKEFKRIYVNWKFNRANS